MSANTRSPGKDLQRSYQAFISYSHDSSNVAAAIERELMLAAKRLGKPISVFRDQTGLTLGALSDRIKSAIDHSDKFILVASPGAADSLWVNEEVLHWVSLERSHPPLLVKADQSINLNWAIDGFSTPNHLPPAARSIYSEEPLFSDLADLRGRLRPTCTNRTAVAQLAATIIPDATPGEILTREDKVLKARRIAGIVASAMLISLVGVTIKSRVDARKAAENSASATNALRNDRAALDGLLGPKTNDVDAINRALDATSQADPSPTAIDSLRSAVTQAKVYRSYPIPPTYMNLVLDPLGRVKDTVTFAGLDENRHPVRKLLLDLKTGMLTGSEWNIPFEPGAFHAGLSIETANSWAHCFTNSKTPIPILIDSIERYGVTTVVDSAGGIYTLNSDCSMEPRPKPSWLTWIIRQGGVDLFADDGRIVDQSGNSRTAMIETLGGCANTSTSATRTSIAIQGCGVGDNLRSMAVSVFDTATETTTAFENPGGELREISPLGTSFIIAIDTGHEVVDVKTSASIATFGAEYSGSRYISDSHVVLTRPGFVDLAVIPATSTSLDPTANCASADSVGISDPPRASATRPAETTLRYNLSSGPIEYYGESFVCGAVTTDERMMAVGRRGHIGTGAVEIGHAEAGSFVSDWRRIGVWSASVEPNGERVWWIDDLGKVGSIEAPWREPRQRFETLPAEWIAANQTIVAVVRSGGLSAFDESYKPSTVFVYTTSGIQMTSFRSWQGISSNSGRVVFSPCAAVAVQESGDLVAYNPGCGGTDKSGDVSTQPAALPSGWRGDLEDLQKRARDFLQTKPPTD